MLLLVHYLSVSYCSTCNGVLCLVLAMWYSSLCHILFYNLTEEEKAGCFALIVLFYVCVCPCLSLFKLISLVVILVRLCAVRVVLPYHAQSLTFWANLS